MLFELIATISAGFAGFGIATLLRRISGLGLPRAAVPVAAAVAMIAVIIANEYGWYKRKLSTLPPGFEIVKAVEQTAFYRPWTYAYPFVTHFLALDRQAAQTHPAQPGQFLVDVYAFTRWQAPGKVSVVVDCLNERRANIVDAVTVAEDGSIENVHWFEPGTDDALLVALCNGNK